MLASREDFFCTIHYHCLTRAEYYPPHIQRRSEGKPRRGYPVFFFILVISPTVRARGMAISHTTQKCGNGNAAVVTRFFKLGGRVEFWNKVLVLGHIVCRMGLRYLFPVGRTLERMRTLSGGIMVFEPRDRGRGIRSILRGPRAKDSLAKENFVLLITPI